MVMSPGLVSTLVALVSQHSSSALLLSCLTQPSVSSFSPRYSEVSFLELDKFLEDVRWVGVVLADWGWVCPALGPGHFAWAAWSQAQGQNWSRPFTAGRGV